jgi:uncharacterized integral membrane protein (TIGR00698 family)
LALALLIAAAASGLGHWVPVIGGPVFGIVIGIILAQSSRRWDAAIRPGRTFASKRILQASIVVLGAGLSLRQIARAGVESLPVMLGTLTLALLAAWLLGRLMHVDNPLRTLIGVGTGICGASAIAATAAVVSAAELEVAYAISTIFLFNVVAVLLFPALGHLFGFSQHAFGLWAGTAVNDTSSVVAAAYTYGHGAGDYAVVVKLTRTLMIIPIVLVLAAWYARRRRESVTVGESGGVARVAWYKAFPMFIAYFVLAALINTLGLIPDSWHHPLSSIAIFLITVALTAVGLSTSFTDMRRTGPRPLLLGGALWVTVASSSIALQAITGQL